MQSLRLSLRLILFIGYITTNVNIAFARALDSKFNLTTFEEDKIAIKDEKDKNYISLDFARLHAIKHGLSSKKKAEQVFQAWYKVSQKAGNLIPNLRLGCALGVAQLNPFQIIPSLVGFLFPSNWYAWKESKLLAKAEFYSYLTMQANLIHTVEIIYYKIHMHLFNLHIAKYYRTQIDKVIAVVLGQEERSICPEQEGILKKIKADVQHQVEDFKFLLKELVVELAISIDLPGRWDKEYIQTLSLESMSGIKKFFNDKYLQEILEKSTEIKNILYLIEASKKSKDSRLYEFLQPEPTGAGLGHGYQAYYKIGKSYVDELLIMRKETLTNLQKALIEAQNLLNSSIGRHEASYSAKKAMVGPAEALAENVFDTATEFDIEKALRYFEYAMQADYRLNSAKHHGLIAQSMLKRLLWAGTLYNSILETSFSENPAPKLMKKWLEKLRNLKGERKWKQFDVEREVSKLVESFISEKSHRLLESKEGI